MDDVEGVSQLREVFDSCCCDASVEGYLDEAGLRELCEKLHLSGHANLLVEHLLCQSPQVNFEEFKECFVAILSQEIPPDDRQSVATTDREVSPKFVLGRKKYGRRSRPASIVDDDTLIEQHSLTTVENLGKRPVSPNDQLQPPTKSGRRSVPPEATGHYTSGSSDSSEHSFESNPVEYLRDTWKKLGVGQDGFLNVEELAHVCEHIGMDMTEEVVVQLFQKLDCDQDGQISFEEFLQGLFQHDPTNNDNNNDHHHHPSQQQQQCLKDDDQHHPLLMSNGWPSGIFSSIDPGHTGCADASTILELWESLEMRCPPRLIEELGYSASSKINLSDLTTTFEDILSSALKRPVLQLAFATFQNELQYLRQSVDGMREERRKLRINVEEANARAALLAQEVDDNHAKLENSLQKKLTLLERKWQDQVRDLCEELRGERDQLHSQGLQLQRLQQELDRLHEEGAKAKDLYAQLQQENSRLEAELRETAERCLTAEKWNEASQKELVALPALKKKVEELESQMLQEQQHQALLMELESCKKNNQELQDKIDELTLEMENIQQRSGSTTGPTTKGVARNHSWLSDYKNTSATGGYKRRGSESSSEENSDEDGIVMNGMKESNDRPLDDMNVSEAKGATNTSAVYLLKDMFLEQSLLMQRLQAAEEKWLRTETAHRRAQIKIRTLQQIIESQMIITRASPLLK